ncbi:hypothetical protein D3C84_774890 [compost metagenome]
MPGTFAGPGEFIDLNVTGNRSDAAVTLIRPHEIALAFCMLVTQAKGVGLNLIAEQGAGQAIVDFAHGDAVAVVAACKIALFLPGKAAVLAIARAVVVAQVSREHSIADSVLG